MRILKLAGLGVDAAVTEAAEALAAGRLIVIPTDTVYGVAADARLPNGDDLLYAAKNRPPGKPIPLLAADLAAVEAHGAILGPEESRLARRYWPGPLTLILSVPTGGRLHTEGFRVPDDDLTRGLLRAVGGVLRATSANRSGEPPALTAGAAAEALGESVELVLDAGPARGGVPSSVVRIEDGGVVVLREGALSTEELARVAKGEA
jgi:tRNA threonylcarbamoyl adenosine modification protein (Sua5/YciO/YrdC/YwlC family)